MSRHETQTARVPPPLRRSGYSGAARKLDESYALWRAHYAACATCQHEDWMYPDEELLCPPGGVLFHNWVRAALAPPTQGGYLK